MGTDKLNPWGNPAIDEHPIQVGGGGGGEEKYSKSLYATETEDNM